MEVCYRKYDERFSVQTIEQTIRETGDEAPSYSRFDLRTNHRECCSASHCAVQLIEKLPPQARRLLVVPFNSVVNFTLSDRKKVNLHERRCFAITVS